MPPFPHLEIKQPKNGFRYGIDSFLLVRFAQLKTTDHICDLGAGVGLIGLLALSRFQVAKVCAVEVQKKSADYALLNTQKNGFENRVSIFNLDWRQVKHHLKPKSFDGVISNPPYRKMNTGKPCKLTEKNIAKYETLGGLEDLLKSANFLLKDKGRLYLIYPVLRLEELLLELKARGLKAKRLAFVHPFSDQAATHFLIEAIRSQNCELTVEAPVIIYEDPDRYRPEIEAWVGVKLYPANPIFDGVG